jgi:hypothetical protein
MSITHEAVVAGPVPPPVVQQYAVPAPPGTPPPQLSVGLSDSGVSLPEHENPMDEPVHPWTVASSAQVPDDGA